MPSILEIEDPNEKFTIPEERWSRNVQEDLAVGLNAAFELKKKLDELHPVARDLVWKILI